MAADSEIHEAQHPLDSNSEVERLLAEVASGAATPAPAAVVDEPKENVARYDLSNATFLSPPQLRKLQQHQEKFVLDLGARLSVLLRAEVGLKLAAIQTISYRRMEQSWPDPVHLTVFKAEPLRANGVLEIPTPLGLSMIDRLLGGTGVVTETNRKLSDIESGLLEQIVQIILGHWCGHWSKFRELKPVIVGHETNGRFIQPTLPQTNILAVSLAVEIGEAQDRIQIGLPYAVMEPLIRQLAQTNESSPEAPMPSPAAASKWNPCFDDMPVQVKANWPQLEVAAGDVLQLKVGDVLRLNSQCAQNVTINVGDLPKFSGRLGTSGGRWAVEITQIIK